MAILQVAQRLFDCAAINRFLRLFSITIVQLGQVLRDVLLQLRLLAFELLDAQVLAQRGHRLEFAAVDGHQVTGDQPYLAAELYERFARCLKGRAIVLAKISDGLEVRCQAAEQPHHLDIALALGLQSA